MCGQNEVTEKSNSFSGTSECHQCCRGCGGDTGRMAYAFRRINHHQRPFPASILSRIGQTLMKSFTVMDSRFANDSSPAQPSQVERSEWWGKFGIICTLYLWGGWGLAKGKTNLTVQESVKDKVIPLFIRLLVVIYAMGARICIFLFRLRFVSGRLFPERCGSWVQIRWEMRSTERTGFVLRLVIRACKWHYMDNPLCLPGVVGCR